MADAKQSFRFCVFGALVIAEAELKRKGLEPNRVKEAVSDLVELIGPISERHFGDPQLGKLFPMIERLADRWYKRLCRRMSTRCGVLNPWIVFLEEQLPRELFSVDKDIVLRTNYGVTVEETQRTTAMVFHSAVRVRRLVEQLTRKQYSQRTF